MKQITINFINGSQAIYEVPDDELQDFFKNVYDLLYDKVLNLELITVDRKNSRIRKE